MMAFGATLLTIGFLLYSRIQSITHMYVLHCLFSLVLVSSGLIMAVMLVSHWFVAKRGTAIGIALVGTSLGGIFFPQVGTWLITNFGWRKAMMWEAVFPIILLLVVVTGRFLLHPLLHRVARAGSPEVFTASAVLIVLGTAMATEHAGLSMAIGAFLAGLLISESAYRQQVIAEIQPFRGLLLGLFFMSMGMS